MATLLAQHGEVVHVIAHRWDGAARPREELLAGRLVVHRVALDEPAPRGAFTGSGGREVPEGLLASACPVQAFAWQAARLAERLIESEGIDIVEAQEWEAPLYYLQLRRALGLGPRRRPPCLVHLHSSAAQIFEANGWDTSVVDYAPAAAMETLSIQAADALLCPSRFMAADARRRYGVDAAALHVIPYPRGDAAPLARPSEVWSAGAICHVGRLEVRKGIFEWVDAAVSVARARPGFTVEFVGADTPVGVAGGATVGDAVRHRIPRELRPRFRFHGNLDRRGVNLVLARSWAAVVPSRWDNLPYSCIEAMSSGLPIITSPHGGMTELVTDGESGWVARDGTAGGLAGALQRALDTPPAKREHLGAAAGAAVRDHCSDDRVLARHLEVKRSLVQAPLVQAHGDALAVSVSGPVPDDRPARRGVAVIVSAPPGVFDVAACIASVTTQTAPAVAAAIVIDTPVATGSPDGWTVAARTARGQTGIEASTAARMASADPRPLAIAWVASSVRLAPEALAWCDAAFAADSRLGLLGGWMRDVARRRVTLPYRPDAPHLDAGGALLPVVIIRTDAFSQAAGHTRSDDVRAICEAVIRAGWRGATYPAVLGSVIGARGGGRRPAPVYSSMARAVQRLHTPLMRWLLAAPVHERRAFVRQGLRHPARTARWLAGRALRRWSGPVTPAEGRPLAAPQDSDLSHESR